MKNDIMIVVLLAGDVVDIAFENVQPPLCPSLQEYHGHETGAVIVDEAAHRPGRVPRAFPTFVFSPEPPSMLLAGGFR